MSNRKSPERFGSNSDSGRDRLRASVAERAKLSVADENIAAEISQDIGISLAEMRAILTGVKSKKSSKEYATVTAEADASVMKFFNQSLEKSEKI